jgi:hypothetical protein
MSCAADSEQLRPQQASAAFKPLGQAPNLGPARPDSAVQREQMSGDPKTMALT